MNLRASAARCSCRLFFSIVISAAFAFLFTGAHPLPALADGGVSFVGTGTTNFDTLTYNTVTGRYRITLIFDKNVGYADAGRDDAFIENNVEKVHVLDAQGNEVEGLTVCAGSSREERQLLYVDITEWLAPLTTYTVYIDEGIQAANGVDVSTESYEFTFRTSAQCSNGLSLYQNILIPTFIILIVCGVATGIIRTRKERR